MDRENVANTNSGLSVLMFPWLAVGHITPSLELAKKLCDRGFCILLCSTPINLSFIRKKIPEKYTSSIHLVELHLPELPELPPQYHTTNGLPLHLNHTLQKALEMAKPTFSDIVTTLKPHLLIYDALQPWAAAVAKWHNVPAVRFMTSGAAVYSYLIHFLHRPNAEYPFPELYLSNYDHDRIQKMLDRRRSSTMKGSVTEDKNTIVISTSREIEGKYVDYMGEILSHCKILPLGTLVPEPVVKRHDQDGSSELLMQWLGTKEEKSTVFASFGSECFLSHEDMQEVAFGLEQSGVNFIWVVRFPKSGDETTHHNNVEEALPEGFLERVGDRGRVVEGWAPQARILSHPNIGGFMSHCGWNSLMESIGCGVPVIAMPMQFDQPVNARLIVDIGVGVEVVRDETRKLHREDVATVVNEVILGEVGENVRKNVKEMSENVRLKTMKEIDETALVLAQLCTSQ